MNILWAEAPFRQFGGEVDQSQVLLQPHREMIIGFGEASVKDVRTQGPADTRTIIRRLFPRPKQMWAKSLPSRHGQYQ